VGQRQPIGGHLPGFMPEKTLAYDSILSLCPKTDSSVLSAWTGFESLFLTVCSICCTKLRINIGNFIVRIDGKLRCY